MLPIDVAFVRPVNSSILHCHVLQQNSTTATTVHEAPSLQVVLQLNSCLCAALTGTHSVTPYTAHKCASGFVPACKKENVAEEA